MIDGLSSDQELCLISFDNAPRKLTGFTNNKRLLRDALDQIAVADVASDLEQALRLVQALGRSEPFDEVLLFSDGNFPPRVNFDLSFKLNYQRLPTGRAEPRHHGVERPAGGDRRLGRVCADRRFRRRRRQRVG